MPWGHYSLAGDVIGLATHCDCPCKACRGCLVGKSEELRARAILRVPYSMVASHGMIERYWNGTSRGGFLNECGDATTPQRKTIKSRVELIRRRRDKPNIVCTPKRIYNSASVCWHSGILCAPHKGDMQTAGTAACVRL